MTVVLSYSSLNQLKMLRQSQVEKNQSQYRYRILLDICVKWVSQDFKKSHEWNTVIFYILYLWSSNLINERH